MGVSKTGPGAPKLTETDFVEMFKRLGPNEMSRQTGISITSIFARRTRLEKKLGFQITGPEHHKRTRHGIEHPGRLHFKIKNGVVLVGSDSHYWPGVITTAHRAFVKFCKDLQPKAIIKNGDELDGAAISRFPPIGWEKRPALSEEIEAVKDRLDEITIAAPKARRFWPLGNHDARLETRLATVAPEYAKVHGIHLRDHFPDWEPCWSVWINRTVVVKHRIRGGIHATRNNTLNAGLTTVTGHLHSLKVSPITDYNGTRFGVDCGTLADPFGPQFGGYMEDSPRDWRAGFVVLTFRDGRLMWPEIVSVIDEDTVDFRGEIIKL